MVFKKFEDIKAWQLARELNKSVYDLTRNQYFKKDFSLTDQVRRASVSVTSNIAEGFDSGTTQAFINFLRYSFRSSSEVKSILYLALDEKYITEEEFCSVSEQINHIRKLLVGLRKYLEQKISTSN